MIEELPTMILLNIALGTAQLETMEDELYSQVILNPVHSITLLQEAMMEISLSTRILKLAKT